MENYIQAIFAEVSHPEILSAVIGFFILILVRYLVIRAVGSINFKDYDVKARWISTTKSLSFLVIVVIFMLMWGDELRSMAISLAAVAVALVLALKELILCFIGGILKASSKLFEVGDRINIKGIRGEIIDHSFLTTTLFEIGPGETSNQYTGRQVRLPNSFFLTDSFFITPSGNHYTLQVMLLRTKLDKSLFEKQQILLKAAQDVSAPYATLAEEYIQRMCKKQNVKILPDLKPRVLYETPDANTVEFHVRVPMPFNAMTRTENKIKDMFFAEVFKRGI